MPLLLLVAGGVAVFWVLPKETTVVQDSGPEGPIATRGAEAEPVRHPAGVSAPMPAVAPTFDLVKTLPELELAFRQSGPDFDHEFLEEGPVAEERIVVSKQRGVIRQRIMRTPQYPDPVFVEEVYRLDVGGAWHLTEQRLEVADEWMLKTAPENTALIDMVVAAENAEVIRSLDHLGLWTLRFEGETIESRETRRVQLSRIAGVEEVLPNDIIWPTAAPNDPSYASQWEFAFMEAEAAWDIITDATINDRVTVAAAIIDTGVNVNNSDINAWVNPGEIAGNGSDDDGNGYVDDINGYDFYARTGTVQRSGGHGVSVAYFAGRIGNNGNSKASASWKLDIIAGICFSTSGAGSSSAANQAISYAVNNGARVVNCSFVGGSAYTYKYSIDAAEAAGVIVVAGAGNNNGRNLTTTPMYPVSSTNSNVVGVGATTSSDVRASYSNIGNVAVEVFAPAPSSGTSFATPVVTSIVSLLIADDPEASHREIIDRLVRGVDKKDDLIGKSVSGGRVNMLKSLRLNTLRRPKDLVAYAVPGEGNRLFWMDQSTAEIGFIVERSTTDPDSVRDPDDLSQMSWQVINSSVPANTTTFLDTNATSGQTYFYRVRAKGSARNSARNHTTRITPISAATPSVAQPAASVPLQTLGDSGSILLEWEASGSALSGYVVERSDDGGASYYILETVGADVSTYADTSVASGITYAYRVKAITAAGGVYSVTKHEKAEASSNAVWIQSPESLVVTANDHRSVTLTWVDRSSGETGFRIERAGASGEFSTLATVAPNTSSYSDSTVAMESDYRYRVVALGDVLSRASDVFSVQVPGLPYTLAIPTVSGSVSDFVEVSIAWTDSSTNASGFRIERALRGSGGFEAIATLSPTVRDFVETPPSRGSIYDYRVIVFVDPDELPSVAYDERVSDVLSFRILTAFEAWAESTLQSSEASMSDDPDSDGWNNLSEFAVFQSPTSPQPFIALPGMSSDGRVTLSFPRRSHPTIDYVVQVTGELGNSWVDAARLHRGAEAWSTMVDGIDVSESGVGERREVIVTDSHRPAATAPRYMRLIIE